MPATVLPTQATEDSTYVVTVTFRDEDGSLVVPNTITWSLKNDQGTVINARSTVSVAVPASSVDIVLKAGDLEPGTCDVAKLLFTVTAAYDSALGTNLPLLGQCWILVGALEPSD